MKRRPARRKKKVITRPMRKIILRVGIASAIFLISATFLGFYSLHKYVNHTYASALSTSTKSVVENKIPAISYIVVKNFRSDPLVLKKVRYIIFDKDTKKVLLYDLPVDNNYELPGKFGREDLSKMFALGGLNSNDPLEGGVETINRSITKLFGFKVDKFMLVSEEEQPFFDDLWTEGGVINLIRVARLISSEDAVISNMNLKDLYDLVSFIDSLPRDRVVKDIPPPCYCDTQYFDDLIREVTLESEIAQEKKDIAVLNGTNINGLANFGARLVRNLGGRVIAIADTERFYDNSFIVAEDINSQTVEVLSRVLRINNIIMKSESHSFMENELNRSDIVIIFGFDTSGDLY